HGLRRLTYVPRDGTIDHLALGGGVDLNGTYGRTLGPIADVILLLGGGGGFPTTFVDGYAQGGVEVSLGSRAAPVIRVGLIGRLGEVDDPVVWEGFHAGI